MMSTSGHTGERSPFDLAKVAIGHEIAAWRQFVPRRMVDALSKDAKELVISLEDKVAGPTVQGRAGPERLDDAYLQGARRRWRGLISATLRVPVHKCMIRELSLPKAAMRRVDEVLRLDLVRTLPFRLDEVLTGWYLPPQADAGDHILVHQIVLKRSLVSAILDELARVRMPLRSISVIADDGSSLPVNLLEPALRLRAPVSRIMSAAVKLLAAGVAISSAGAFALTMTNLQTALATVESDVRTATGEAQTMRMKVGEAQASAAQLRRPRLRKIGTTPVVAIWEEVTRILPPATSLTDLRVEGASVQLDGQSANASELIAFLAASPMFSNVGFASPVTRDAQRGTERFQIKLQTSRSGPQDQDQSPAPAKAK